MFDFDDYEDLSDYAYTYPVKDILQQAYTKKNSPTWEYRDFIVRYVEAEVLAGQRQFHEDEQAWQRLQFYMNQVSEDFFNPYSTAKPAEEEEKVYILYDQTLLLLYDGNPIGRFE